MTWNGGLNPAVSAEDGVFYCSFVGFVLAYYKGEPQILSSAAREFPSKKLGTCHRDLVLLRLSIGDLPGKLNDVLKGGQRIEPILFEGRTVALIDLVRW